MNKIRGITRQTAIDLAKELKIPTKKVSITSEQFKNSKEAFATSTAGGIIPITKIDGKVIGDGTMGTITSIIKDLYWEKHTDPDWSESVEDLL